MRSIVRWTALTLGAAVLLSCARFGGQSLPLSPPPVSPVATGIEVGQRARDIKGTDIDGKEFALSDYRGKVVLLDFWATW